MKTIGLLSDTHGYLDQAIFKYFDKCDEIWHAGDFGSSKLVDELVDFKPLRGVYGNIDSIEIRKQFPEILQFDCEKVKVMMAHIGGYPQHYTARVKEILSETTCDVSLFISGHSHILKIMHDTKFKLLHINPGAAGREGWHKVRTLIRFCISEEKIHTLEVIELGKR